MRFFSGVRVMKKTMVYLTERQRMQLKQKASEKNTSVAELIRSAVDAFLLREKPAVDYMSIVGMAEGVQGEHVSEQVDQVLADIMKNNDQTGKPPSRGKSSGKSALGQKGKQRRSGKK